MVSSRISFSKGGKALWRILIVDDNFVNRKLLLEILKNTAQCDVASNGKEGVEAYRLAIQENKPYHLILLDVAMPEMDGLEVLRTIRSYEQSQGVTLGEGIPIIMVTAFKDPVFDAFNKGCDDYMLKPIQADVLIDKIIQRLSSQHK